MAERTKEERKLQIIGRTRMDSKQLKARAPASLILLVAASLRGVPGSQAQKSLKELIGSASFRHPVLTLQLWPVG